MSGCYERTDFEWSVIAPLLPNKTRGAPRVYGQRSERKASLLAEAVLRNDSTGEMERLIG